MASVQAEPALLRMPSIWPGCPPRAPRRRPPLPGLSSPARADSSTRLRARDALADRYGSAERPDDLLGELAGWRSDIDRERILARIRSLKFIERALQQGCGHKMAVAPRQVFGHDVPAAAQIDQPHLRPVADYDLAIGSLERGAGDDPRLFLRALTVDPGGRALEPRLPVRVGQRHPGVHLGDVRLGVERIALLEGPAEAPGQFLRNRRLARPRHAHDHQNWRTAPMGAYPADPPAWPRPPRSPGAGSRRQRSSRATVLRPVP